MTARLLITWEDEQALRHLGEVEHQIRVEFASKAALLVKEYAEEEGGAVTPKLRDGWRIYGFGDTYTRHVRASKDNWWAHFLAGGTKPHGPRNAPQLVFKIDGHMIRTTQVRGVTATHFDKKAVDRAGPRLAGLLKQMIEESG